MALIFVTDIYTSGKTTVSNELSKRGFKTYGTMPHEPNLVITENKQKEM
jgi:tRNA uridine 5-carbamoylmethylation protein Kti12